MKKPIDPAVAHLADQNREVPLAPLPHVAPPGQNAIAYRVGTHASFLARSKVRIGSHPPLRALRTRDPADPTLALLDAWASAGEVLSFYQERTINEHYLRTATERRSLLELGRLLGYELAPGVAATAYLAFTIDDSPAAPAEAPIPAGTRVSSIPGPGELPQVFETSRELVARPEWNQLKLRATIPQEVPEGPATVELDGQTDVRAGDFVLALAEDETNVLEALSSSFDRVRNISELRLVTPESAQVPPPIPLPRFLFRSLGIGSFLYEQRSFDRQVVETELYSKAWNTRVLRATVRAQRWSLRAVQQLRYVAPERTTSLFGFGQRARLFGHNAPAYSTLPEENRPVTDWDASDFSPATTIGSDPVYCLDSTYPVLRDSYVVALVDGRVAGWARITWVRELSLARYMLSGKSTEIRLGPERSGTLSALPLRRTVFLVVSKPLPLSPVPVDLPAPDELVIEGRQILDEGQFLAIEGERSDLPGIKSREIAVVKMAEVRTDVTRVQLTADLEHAYVPSKVQINANVAIATHGESTQEVLGSGDGQRSFQTFALKKAPLTYVPSREGSGKKTTLELRVNGVLWEEVESLQDYGRDARVYLTRRDDAGNTLIMFGDGINGSRLPSGQENVVARYRIGSGSAGLLKADQLTLLLVRPLGVRNVTNPVETRDAGEAETRDDARLIIPTIALTLDRVVSRADYAAFSARFAGISKADASWVWDGKRDVLVVTVAGEGGRRPSTDLMASVDEALDKAGGENVPRRVVAFRAGYFVVRATLDIDPALERARVLADAEARLRARYSFKAVRFGQSVAKSEVIALLHETPGVRAVDLDVFERLGEDGVSARLVAGAPQLADAGEIEGAELLELDPGPLDLR
jgi:hypothetical protein